MRRIVLAALALGAALLIQLTLLNGLILPGGGTPDLILLCVVALALVGGPAAGTAAGFFAGLGLDLAPPASELVGQYALVFCLAGYCCGRLRSALHRSALLAFGVAALAAAAAEVLAAGLTLTLDSPEVTGSTVALILPSTVLYNIALSPLVLFAAVRGARMLGAAWSDPVESPAAEPGGSAARAGADGTGAGPGRWPAGRAALGGAALGGAGSLSPAVGTASPAGVLAGPIGWLAGPAGSRRQRRAQARRSALLTGATARKGDIWVGGRPAGVRATTSAAVARSSVPGWLGYGRFRQAGPDRFRPAGPDRFRPAGPDRLRPAGSDRLRPAGSDRLRPAGPDRLRPANGVAGSAVTACRSDAMLPDHHQASSIRSVRLRLAAEQRGRRQAPRAPQQARPAWQQARPSGPSRPGWLGTGRVSDRWDHGGRFSTGRLTDSQFGGGRPSGGRSGGRGLTGWGVRGGRFSGGGLIGGGMTGGRLSGSRALGRRFRGTGLVSGVSGLWVSGGSVSGSRVSDGAAGTWPGSAGTGRRSASRAGVTRIAFGSGRTPAASPTRVGPSWPRHGQAWRATDVGRPGGPYLAGRRVAEPRFRSAAPAGQRPGRSRSGARWPGSGPSAAAVPGTAWRNADRMDRARSASRIARSRKEPRFGRRTARYPASGPRRIKVARLRAGCRVIKTLPGLRRAGGRSTVWRIGSSRIGYHR
jgi:rod shape-determining protein MreD